MSEFSTPAGWYPDGDGWERRWDGAGWTDDRRQMEPPTQVRPDEAAASPYAPGPQAQAPQDLPPQGPPPQGPPPQGPPPQGPPPGQFGAPSYGHVPSTGLGAPHPGQPGPAGPPPGFGAGFGAPGYGPPQGPSGGRRTWLWLTLGLVVLLVVAAGVTLAVVQPWSDDDTSTADDGDGEGGDGKGGDGTKTATHGDIDGDGLGDVAYYFRDGYDKVTLMTAISTGNGFEVSEVLADPNRDPAVLHIDWDGDGVTEPLSWSFVGNQLTLSSTDDDFPPSQIHTLQLATLKEYGDVEIDLMTGDFDGDGDVDVAVAGQNNRTVDVSVLANDGEGAFADPVRWLSIPDASADILEIFAGDFDGDGDHDLWAQLPAERLDNEDYTRYYSGDRGFALLKSNGDAFELGAVNESRLYFERMLAADLTGDGTTYIIGLQTNSFQQEMTVSVFDVSSGQFKEVSGFGGTAKIGQRSLSGATTSDVNGDGKADLVFAVRGHDEQKFTGIQVMTSTGAVLEDPLVWAETPPCVEDDCRIQFRGTPQY